MAKSTKSKGAGPRKNDTDPTPIRMTLQSKKGTFAPMAGGRLQGGAMKNYRGKGKP